MGTPFSQAFSHTRLLQGADLTPRAVLWKPTRVTSPQTQLLGVADIGVAFITETAAFPAEQQIRQKAKKEAGHVAKMR